MISGAAISDSSHFCTYSPTCPVNYPVCCYPEILESSWFSLLIVSWMCSVFSSHCHCLIFWLGCCLLLSASVRKWRLQYLPWNLARNSGLNKMCKTCKHSRCSGLLLFPVICLAPVFSYILCFYRATRVVFSKCAPF